MDRTRAVALGLVAVGALAGWRALTWPTSEPALDCPPGAIHLDEQGVARCGQGAPLPAGQAVTVGRRLRLDLATAEDLALIPGISAALAQRLVAARTALGGFGSWTQVDAVEGVGPVRLERLQRFCELSATDAGL
jgi:competence protein ComEA